MRKAASVMPRMSALSERRVMPPYPHDGFACSSASSSSRAQPSGPDHSKMAMPSSCSSAHSAGSMPPSTTSSPQEATTARAASRWAARTTDFTSPALEVPQSWPDQKLFVVWLVAFHASQVLCSRSSSIRTRAAGFPRAFLAARIS